MEPKFIELEIGDKTIYCKIIASNYSHYVCIADTDEKHQIDKYMKHIINDNFQWITETTDLYSRVNWLIGDYSYFEIEEMKYFLMKEHPGSVPLLVIEKSKYQK